MKTIRIYRSYYSLQISAKIIFDAQNKKMHFVYGFYTSFLISTVDPYSKWLFLYVLRYLVTICMKTGHIKYTYSDKKDNDTENNGNNHKHNMLIQAIQSAVD